MNQWLTPAWGVLDRVRSSAETSVIVCVDVEPDPRTFDPAATPPWLGFESLLGQLPALRDRLEAATGHPVPFSWFLRMDPQIEGTWGAANWVCEAYGDELSKLGTAGDELALHSHCWRQDDEGWFADYADPGWAAQCLEIGLDAFEAGFGSPCRAHRAGDHYLDREMISLLIERGVNVDLTVEPGVQEMDGLGIPEERIRGRIPGYRDAPTSPYRITPESFPAPALADEGQLIIPLLSAPARRPPFRRVPLSPVQAPNIFGTRLAAELLRNPPIVAVAMRTDSVICHEWDNIQENLVHLAGRRGVRFETANAAAERFQPEEALPV